MFGHANFDSLVTSCVVFLFFFDFCVYEKAVQIQRLPGAVQILNNLEMLGLLPWKLLPTMPFLHCLHNIFG